MPRRHKDCGILRFAKSRRLDRHRNGYGLYSVIAANQVKGTGTRQDDNFLWYSEESVIQDYNAAFFICCKFLELLLLCPEKLSEEEKELLRFHAFQGDLEPSPAIRNYNTCGLDKTDRATKLITGVTNDPKESGLPLRKLMLFRDDIEKNEENRKACEELWKQKTLVTHIFDDVYATTYRGENVHLGTINEYPFMQSTMQNPSWGTGWQSLPPARNDKCTRRRPRYGKR